MSKPASISHQKSKSTIETLVFIGLLIALFYPPYLRGLYFDRELVPTQVLISTIFMAFIINLIKKRESVKISTLMEYGLIGLLFAYILPFIFGQAAYARTAVGEILKYATYISIFIIVKNIIETESKNKILLNTLLVSSIGVAIIGIGSAIGTFNYNGAYVWGRINSTLQYPNTLASYMLAMLILTVGLFLTSNKLWQKLIYQASAFILFFTFIFTYSRGVYLLFPIMIFTVLIGLNKEDILKSIFFTLNFSLSTVLLMNMFSSSIKQGLIAKSWLIILAGIIISIILYFIFNFIVSKLNKVNSKILLYIGVFIILAVILLGGNILYTIIRADSVDAVKNSFIGRLVPEFMLSRLIELDLDDVNTLQRAYYYKDAFKIIKDYPIIGAGGGGWAALYGMYQSFFYTSTQTHNYVIQTWIETGIVGLIFLMVLMMGVVFSIVKYFKSKLKRPLLWTVIVSSISLFIHSIMDFDFALTSVMFIFITLIALADRELPSKISDKLKLKLKLNLKLNLNLKLINGLLITLGLALLIISSSLWIGSLYAGKAVDAAKAQNLDVVITNFNKAKTFDPFKIEYKLDLASMYRNKFKLTNDQNYIIKEKELYESISKISPFNSYALARISSFYISVGEINKGLDYLEKSIEVQPLRAQNYTQKAQCYIQVGMYYLKNKKTEEAIKCFEKVAAIEKDISKLNKNIVKPIVLEDDTVKYIQQAKDLISKLKP